MAHRRREVDAMRGKGLLQFCSWMRLIPALPLCAALISLPEWARAKEFWFVAQELGQEKGTFEMGETEIWLPNAVIIDQKEDLDEPLWFVLQNPTDVDHEFAVWGLFMLLPEGEAMPETKLDPDSGGLLARSVPVPLHLKVQAGQTKRVQVAPRGLVGEKNLGARYPFFCTKHKDIRVSGFIYVD
ncbi:MAG: hypothetical protein P0121_03495 [Nitrospira sp.]|nr:hypothetical protein [Nitrospira sp.]